MDPKEHLDQTDHDIDDTEERIKFPDFLSEHVGGCGRHQWVLAIPMFLKHVGDALLALAPVFIAAIPEHKCDIKRLIPALINCSQSYLEEVLIPKETRNGEVVPSQCKYYDIRNVSALYNIKDHEADICPSINVNETDIPEVKCDKWTYDHTFYTTTIVSDWDLVCSKSGLVSNVSSVYWVGVILGLIIGGHLADRWGRKPTAVVGYILMLILIIAAAFSPNYWVFLALRFLTPIFTTFRAIGTWIACIETLGDNWRMTYFTIETIGWSTGYFVMTGIAYMERRWRYLQMIMIFPEVIGFLIVAFYYTESPRWLLTQNRKEEAMKYLKLIARRNHRHLPPNIVPIVEKETQTVSAIQLFRWPNIRNITFIQFYLWLSMGFVYYGISMNTGNLGGNPFVNFAISGVVDLISSLLSLVAIHKCGRVPSFCYGMLAGGVVLIISVITPAEKHVWILVIAMVGKFFTAIPGNATWIYALELYPTSIRSIGVNMCSIMARLGAIGASYLDILININRSLPLLVFGISSLIGGCLAFILPETKNTLLKQTIEEGEEFIKQYKCMTIPCKTSKCRKRSSIKKLKNVSALSCDDEEEDPSEVEHL